MSDDVIGKVADAAERAFDHSPSDDPWDDVARAALADEDGDAPRIGERIQDGGEWGVIVRCHECSGQGVLHRLDAPPAPTGAGDGDA